MEAEKPVEIMDEIDLEELFYPPPTKDDALIAPETLIDSIPPPDLDMETQPAENPSQAPAAHEIVDEFDDAQINNCNTNELAFVNSLHAHKDLSKTFRDTLRSRKEKLITFFLSKHDQYVKIPGVGEHAESDID
jgi:hypothetical protein